MSKEKALEKIDKEIGISESGNVDYEALKTYMFNWFSSNELEQFADFIEDENR